MLYGWRFLQDFIVTKDLLQYTVMPLSPLVRMEAQFPVVEE